MYDVYHTLSLYLTFEFFRFSISDFSRMALLLPLNAAHAYIRFGNITWKSYFIYACEIIHFIYR